jgi:hypothetical protein
MVVLARWRFLISKVPLNGIVYGLLRHPQLQHFRRHRCHLQRESSLYTTYRSIIEVIWWTGLAPSEFDFFFSGSVISTFLYVT